MTVIGVGDLQMADGGEVMAETTEAKTLADVLAEMRSGPIPRHRHDRELLQLFADRIEAIAKRAYYEIDHAVCAIEEAFSYDIDNVREAMDGTIGDCYE